MAATITVTYASGSNAPLINGTTLALQLDSTQGYLHANQVVVKAKFELDGADKATIVVGVPQLQAVQKISSTYKPGAPSPLELSYDSVSVAGGTTSVTFEIDPTGTPTVTSKLEALNSVTITVKP